MNNRTLSKQRSNKKGKRNSIYTLMSNELTTKNSLELRVSRYIFYAKETFGFSIVINLIKTFVFKNRSIFIQSENIAVGVIVDVAFTFVTLYLATFLWYEFRVYRHNLKNSK